MTELKEDKLKTLMDVIIPVIAGLERDLAAFELALNNFKRAYPKEGALFEAALHRASKTPRLQDLTFEEYGKPTRTAQQFTRKSSDSRSNQVVETWVRRDEFALSKQT